MNKLAMTALGLALVGAGLIGVSSPTVFGEEEPATPFSEVEVSNKSDESHTLFKVTVADLGDAKFRDLHIKAVPPPGKKHKLPNPKGGGKKGPKVDVTDTNGNKKGSARVTRGDDGEVHVVIDGSGLPAGQYKIDVPWDVTMSTLGGWCQWSTKVTSNGKKDYDEDDEIGTGTDATEFDRVVPGVALLIGGSDGDNALACAVGAMTPFVVSTDQTIREGCEFRVFSSRTLAPEFDDHWEIGILSETDPLPPEWGIDLTGTDGQIAAGGDAPSPLNVMVPNDPVLVGETFYVVFALMTDDNSRVFLASSPIEVNIE